MRQVSGNTLQQVENFMYLGVVFTSGGRRSEEIDTRVDKANAILRGFCCSVVRKRQLSNTAKLSVFKSVFIPILTYGHESWVMTQRILTQVQAPKMGVLRRAHGVTKGLMEVSLPPEQETNLALPYLSLRSFGSKCTALKKKLATLLGLLGAPQWFAALVTPLVWRFETNCAAAKFTESWMSKHFSELRERNHVSSARYPECPTEDWWGKSCWLNPRESDPNIDQGPGGVTSSLTLLGPVLVWNQQNYLKLLLIVRFSKSSYGCCPAGTGLFDLPVSVWAVSVWPFRCGDISATTFLYMNNWLHLFI